MAELSPQQREQLILDNVWVVRKTAFDIFTPEIRKHPKWEDLHQEGLLGLIHAANKVTTETQATFPRFASLHVRKKLVGFWHRENLVVKLPRNQGELAGVMNRECRNIVGNLLPVEECVAKLSNYGAENVRAVWRAMQMRTTPIVEETDDDHLTINLPQSHHTPSAEQEALKREAEAQFERLIGVLNDVASELVRLRYGLATGKPVSVRETAKILGLPVWQVNAIETEALQVLREHTHLIGE